MRAIQAKFAARNMADPTGVADIRPKSARQENGENTEEIGGRHWRDRGFGWLPKEHAGKDGYIYISGITHARPAKARRGGGVIVRGNMSQGGG